MLYFLYSSLLFALQTFVVQTEDDFVHFITDKMESIDFKHFLCPITFKNINYQNKQLNNNNHEQKDENGAISEIDPLKLSDLKDSGSLKLIQSSSDDSMNFQDYFSTSNKINYSENTIIELDKSALQQRNLPEHEIANVARYKSNNNENFTNNQRINENIDYFGNIKKFSYIDDIRIGNDGTITLGNVIINVDDLLSGPKIINGFYISAAFDYTPNIINNTLFIIKSYKVLLMDLVNGETNMKRFNQIYHLQKFFYNKDLLFSGDFKMFLNGKYWKFKSKIKAIFILREKDGIKYMIRLLKGKDFSIANINWKSQKNKKGMGWLKIVPLIIMPLITYIWTKRSNIKYGSCLSEDNKVFLGKFLKRDCIIEKCINSGTLASLKVKHNNVGSALFINYPMVVFEVTRQFTVRNSNLSINANLGYIEKASEDDNNLNTYSDPVNIKENTTTENRSLIENIEKIVEPPFTINPIREKHNIVDVIKEIILAVEFLHSKNIIHNNFCPENIRFIDHDLLIQISNIFEHKGWRLNDDLDFKNDIFSLSCIIHYYLSGYHPYDITENMYQFYDEQIYYRKILEDDMENEVINNICLGNYRIRLTNQIAYDIVYHCIVKKNGVGLSNHPMFWDCYKIIDFISDVSDFLETSINYKQKLEYSKKVVFSDDWKCLVDEDLFNSVLNKRYYDTKSICNLVRFMRNCFRHFMELKNISFIKTKEDIVGYFLNGFPRLLMFLYRSNVLKGQSDFEKYF